MVKCNGTVTPWWWSRGSTLIRYWVFLRWTYLTHFYQWGDLLQCIWLLEVCDFSTNVHQHLSFSLELLGYIHFYFAKQKLKWITKDKKCPHLSIFASHLLKVQVRFLGWFFIPIKFRALFLVLFLPASVSKYCGNYKQRTFSLVTTKLPQIHVPF